MSRIEYDSILILVNIVGGGGQSIYLKGLRGKKKKKKKSKRVLQKSLGPLNSQNNKYKYVVSKQLVLLEQ